MYSNFKTWNPWLKSGNKAILNEKDFEYPVSLKSDYQLSIPSGEIVIVKSDFFLEGTDEWIDKAWNFIICRKDLIFVIPTANPDRIRERLPYGDLTLLSNVQLLIQISSNSDTLQKLIHANRISKYFNGNVGILVSSLTANVSVEKYLKTGNFNCVIAKGSKCGSKCNFGSVLNLREQCKQFDNMRFMFYSTGSNFIKDGKLYHIKDSATMRGQAIKSNLDFCVGNPTVAKAEYPDGREIALSTPCYSGCLYCKNICF